MIGERLITPDASSFPSSGVIFDLADPRTAELSREDRVRLYYAQQLADGNLDALTPRYRCSEDGDTQDPYQDFLTADPLSDPKVSELASVLRSAGYKQDTEDVTP